MSFERSKKVDSQDLLVEEIISNYPKTALHNHIIPFGFSEEDCDVLLKAKDHSMVLPSDFLTSISQCFEGKFVRHNGDDGSGVAMVKTKNDTNDKIIKHSLEMTNLHLKNIIQALSFYYPPKTIPLLGKLLMIISFLKISTGFSNTNLLVDVFLREVQVEPELI